MPKCYLCRQAPVDDGDLPCPTCARTLRLEPTAGAGPVVSSGADRLTCSVCGILAERTDWPVEEGQWREWSTARRRTHVLWHMERRGSA